MFSTFSQEHETTLPMIAQVDASPYQEYSESPLSFSVHQVDSPSTYQGYSQTSTPNAASFPSSNAQIESLYDKLAALPAPDFSQGINVNDLSMDNDYKQGQYYPNMLSPPETPAMPLRNPSITSNSSYQMQAAAQQQQQWARSRSESISWAAPMQDMPPHEMRFPQGHQRAMSLPHIGMPQDFGMMQMNFSVSKPYAQRKSSVCSNASSSDKTFTCSHPGCDRTFSRIQNLRSHMRCHLLTTPHNCKTCGLGFRRTTDLQRHIRTMHIPNDQKPWACSKCSKRFGRSDALKRHMSSRSKDHGCPGGPDMELVRQMEEQKRIKASKQALATVVEGAVF
ncbi:hypothetical protein HDU91_005053 [Kappamyces sp. JEL0680]|nr:hypothetical protein HDU91_005053 [Kappamyces sp. JEL0680]